MGGNDYDRYNEEDKSQNKKELIQIINSDQTYTQENLDVNENDNKENNDDQKYSTGGFKNKDQVDNNNINNVENQQQFQNGSFQQENIDNSKDSQQYLQNDDDIVILEEEIDENFVPDEQQIIEYAEFLGMDISNDQEYFYIAAEGLKCPLPEQWKPAQNKAGEVFYINLMTNEVKIDHPCDEIFRNKYLEAKNEHRGFQGGSFQSSGNYFQMENKYSFQNQPSNIQTVQQISNLNIDPNDIPDQQWLQNTIQNQNKKSFNRKTPKLSGASFNNLHQINEEQLEQSKEEYTKTKSYIDFNDKSGSQISLYGNSPFSKQKYKGSPIRTPENRSFDRERRYYISGSKGHILSFDGKNSSSSKNDQSQNLSSNRNQQKKQQLKYNNDYMIMQRINSKHSDQVMILKKQRESYYNQKRKKMLNDYYEKKNNVYEKFQSQLRMLQLNYDNYLEQRNKQQLEIMQEINSQQKYQNNEFVQGKIAYKKREVEKTINELQYKNQLDLEQETENITKIKRVGQRITRSLSFKKI